MGQERWTGFRLGAVGCTPAVREALAEAGIPPEELLRFHQMPPLPDLQAEHAEALAQRSWICSPFALPQSDQTIWIITDPQQQRTLLYLEPL